MKGIVYGKSPLVGSDGDNLKFYSQEVASDVTILHLAMFEPEQFSARNARTDPRGGRSAITDDSCELHEISHMHSYKQFAPSLIFSFVYN